MGALGRLAGRGGLILPAPESGGLGHLPGVCRSSWQCLTPSSRRAPATEQADFGEPVLIASDALDDASTDRSITQVCCADGWSPHITEPDALHRVSVDMISSWMTDYLQERTAIHEQRAILLPRHNV